jgi:hypothetical protein
MILRSVNRVALLMAALICFSSLASREATASTTGWQVIRPAKLTPSTPTTQQPSPTPPTQPSNGGTIDPKPLLITPTFGSSHIPPGVAASNATTLLLYNASNAPVTVEVTTQSPGSIVQPNCTTQASDIRVTDTQTNTTVTPTPFGAVENGYFTIAAGHTVKITSALGPCLQGLVFFFASPGQCACGPGTTIPNCAGFVEFVAGPAQPNGVNQAEATLNLPNAGSQEACDISCVQGCNSTLQMVITPPAGGPYWYLGNDTTPITTTTSTQNSWVDVANKKDDNCKFASGPNAGKPIPGVFPFGCTTCIDDPSPPCGPAFCIPAWGNTQGCQYNRNPEAGQVFGGTVQFNYLGPLSPPASSQ